VANPRAVTIVVPVYADWPSLKDCLDSLEKFVDITKNKILLVNDCGPEVETLEKNIKAKIAGRQGWEYYRNPKNLGFVGTCNRAVLELDKSGNDILLLNSDTEVTDGFLEEMSQVLYLDSKFATVTPRTNNATLATFPVSAAPQHGIGPAESFRLFLKVKTKLPRASIVPVGHGYCMLIKRNLVDKYGFFDPVFGKGYGEEIDFCLRLRKNGYKCLLANHAYVFHLEARSFGQERKKRLIEEGHQIIWQRYPSYRQTVRDYMNEAVVAESEIIDSATGSTPGRWRKAGKKLIKRNQKLHNLAQKTAARLRGD